MTDNWQAVIDLLHNARTYLCLAEYHLRDTESQLNACKGHLKASSDKIKELEEG